MNYYIIIPENTKNQGGSCAKWIYKAIYEEWLSNPYFDEATKAELRAIAD